MIIFEKPKIFSHANYINIPTTISEAKDIVDNLDERRWGLIFAACIISSLFATPDVFGAFGILNLGPMGFQ